jgi:hypothetical protein
MIEGVLLKREEEAVDFLTEFEREFEKAGSWVGF